MLPGSDVRKSRKKKPINQKQGSLSVPSSAAFVGLLCRVFFGRQKRIKKTLDKAAAE